MMSLIAPIGTCSAITPSIRPFSPTGEKIHCVGTLSDGWYRSKSVMPT